MEDVDCRPDLVLHALNIDGPVEESCVYDTVKSNDRRPHNAVQGMLGGVIVVARGVDGDERDRVELFPVLSRSNELGVVVDVLVIVERYTDTMP